MKLRKVDFDLDWPVSVEIFNLRKFIIANLMKKGRVIRWAIVDIKATVDSSNIKKIRINAVLANSINSK
tara:strand:+ start:147 stop:353 length:207 start_codon:yes stop_codon:yes gene_type:complete